MVAEFNPQKELYAILASQDQPGILAAPKALGICFGWCKQEMDLENGREAHIEDLLALVELAEALETGAAFSSSLVEYLEFAGAGETLTDGIAAYSEQIEAASQYLETLQTDLNMARKQAQVISDQQREKLALEQEHADLQRLIQLADEGGIEALKSQVRALKTRLELVTEGEDIFSWEAETLQVAGDLDRLSKEQLAQAKAELKELLEGSSTSLVELRGIQVMLKEAQARYADSHEALVRHREALALYETADRIVSRAVPGGESVVSILDQVEVQLSAADKALQQAIQANQNLNELRRIYPGSQML